jgi:hypothetical protein
LLKLSSEESNSSSIYVAKKYEAVLPAFYPPSDTPTLPLILLLPVAHFAALFHDFYLQPRIYQPAVELETLKGF